MAAADEVAQTSTMCLNATRGVMPKANLVSDTNPVIQKFLQHDSSFRLADKYLIAMVFVYFKRAQLGPEDYTYLNFFAGLCLAHSMEEDVELSSEIYPWALGSEFEDDLPKLLELKTLLWVGMDYRAAVSQYCCNQLISVSATHPIWQRERTSYCATELLPPEKPADFHVATKRLCTNSEKRKGHSRENSTENDHRKTGFSVH